MNGSMRRWTAIAEGRRKLTLPLACHGIAFLGSAGHRPRRTTMNTNKPNGIGNTSDMLHQPGEPMLLRPSEAARLLAISPRKLWELTNTREVPSVRIGRCLRYPREELSTWVATRLGRRS